MRISGSRKHNSPRNAGCLSKDLRFASRELAEDWIERRVVGRGASPVSWNVYCCRYGKPGNPHYHAGHIPGFIRNHDRMPEHDRTPNRRRKRRHSR